MTVKEIAELCGVDQSTVWRWAQKDDLLQNAKGITEKLEEARKSGKDPADFTLDETLTIIGEGGKNKALASLLAENAVTKNALVVQSEVIAKIAKLAEKLPEIFERIDKLEARQEKFKGQTVEAYKRLEARVDGAYKEVLNSAVVNATAEIQEYLLSSHKPSAHEAQLADLKQYLSLTITVTGDRRDKIEVFRLYPEYAARVENPIPRDAFVANVLLLYPQLKCRGDLFSGIRFDY
jgi:transcriptional regulator with XRE-family HTH domain